MRKKLLYIMHVDWNWIKQRPHYLFENLSKHYGSLAVYPVSRKRTFLVKNSKECLSLQPFIRIPTPFRQKSSLIYEINRRYLRYYFKRLISLYDPDYIWITFPELYDYLPSSPTKRTIIYDCMDDAIAFEAEEGFNQRLLETEKRLIDRSSIIYASSNSLAKKLSERYPCKEKTFLIRNAFGGDIISDAPTIGVSNNGIYKIGYIGTVSNWFDFEALHYTLDNLSNIEYHIIGPTDVDIKPWLHERIKFYGPINHSNLYSHVKGFDCLIMPFRVNELILSVDPVKLYEYINFGKPIVSVHYQEIERFMPYGLFYSMKEDLLSALKHIIKIGFSRSYTDEQRVKFLKENSWDARVREIISHLERLSG